jgi:Ca-activated chloride channel family protein
MRSAIASLTLAFVAAGGALAAPVAPDLDEVGSGEMLRPVEGGYEPLPLLDMDVELEITGTLVHGQVTQRFSNLTGDTIDALYVFPLPENAAVDAMEMRIGDRRIVAVVKEREEAKATYEAARREGKRASLVEQQRPNLFRTSVANVGPGEEVVVKLGYLEEVSWRDGEMGLAFPLTFTPRYNPGSGREPGESRVSLPKASLRVHVGGGSPVEGIRSPSHEIEIVSDPTGTRIVPRGKSVSADRDFLLTWGIRRTNVPTASAFVEDREDGRYALVLVAPPAQGSEAGLGWPTDTVFVVDVSGSMAGPSIEAAKHTVALALERLRPGDTFDVLAFDDGLYPFRGTLQPVAGSTLAEGRRFVDTLQARGGTEIVPALLRAMNELATTRGGRQQRVVLLTDGAVGNEEEAFREVSARLGGARLHVIGIGNAPNRYLMRKLAEIGGGSCEFVDERSDVATLLDAFFRRIDRPVLTDVTVDVEGGGLVERYPSRFPDLHAGDPVFLSLRLGSAGEATRLRLRGRTVEGTFEMQVPLRANEPVGSGVAARFGRKKIESLLDSLREGADSADVRAKVVEVAKEFHLVSPYTSLVAVEELRTDGSRDGALPQTGTNGPLVLVLGFVLLALGAAVYGLSRSEWADA